MTGKILRKPFLGHNADSLWAACLNWHNALIYRYKWAEIGPRQAPFDAALWQKFVLFRRFSIALR
ncbi:MAG: hypothetical protein V4647_11710 [Pseudomonadota bacterium]